MRKSKHHSVCSSSTSGLPEVKLKGGVGEKDGTDVQFLGKPILLEVKLSKTEVNMIPWLNAV